MAQLLDLGVVPVRQVRQDLRPALVADGARALRDVAEDRQRAVAGASRDHPQLHRRQVLRLVDDHVVVRARRLADERVRLVEQRHVGVAPAGTAPAQQPLLVLVEEPLGRLGEETQAS